MKYVLQFFTDPHIGRVLKANTNTASRLALREQLFLHAYHAATMPVPEALEGRRVARRFLAGDLFDTDTNDELTLIQGAQIAKLCDLVLGGNHDVVNIAGRESSFSALSQLLAADETAPTFILPPGPGGTYYYPEPVPEAETMVYLVPHHSTQAEFDKTLDAVSKAAEAGKERRKLLVLHCNWDLQVGAGENDLNLTMNRAVALGKVFDYIILGHDHRPRTELGGKVVILGNTHPTSFSDLGEKVAWFYDPEENLFHTEVICGDAYRDLPASELISAWREDRVEELQARLGAEWLDLTGELDAEESVDLGRAVRKLWANGENLYAIRASKVRFRGLDAALEGKAPEAVNIVERVSQELRENKELDGLYDLFLEAKEKAEK